MAKLKMKSDDRSITVRVPLAIRKRGARKLVLGPDGSVAAGTCASRHVDGAVVKAIARAFRWRNMLEDATYATIAEIAGTEKINETYVGRVLRLALLAPEIVEAVVAGTRPDLRLDR